MDEKALGKRLQAVRVAAGLTQQDLCHKAGLSYSTLTKIERGAIKSPSIFTIQSIATALGATLDDLLGDTAVRHAAKSVSKSGVRFVYFDLNGCLVRFQSSGLTQLAHDSGQPIDTVETVLWEYDDRICRGEATLAEMNAAWSERLGIAVDWKKYYLNAVDPMPGMADLVAWTAKHYRSGILSNTMPGFIAALREQGSIPDVHYDAIVDSSQVHALKPDLEMFEIATAKAGCQPSEILLVDDNRSFLVGAKNAGWHTIWFDPYQPEASVQSVREALEPAA